MFKIKTKFTFLTLLLSYSIQAGKLDEIRNVTNKATEELKRRQEQLDNERTIINLLEATSRDYDALMLSKNGLTAALHAELFSNRTKTEELERMGTHIRGLEESLRTSNQNLEKKTLEYKGLVESSNRLHNTNERLTRGINEYQIEHRNNSATIAANTRTIVELRNQIDMLGVAHARAQERSSHRAVTRENFFTRTLNRIGDALGFRNGSTLEQILRKINENKARLSTLEANNQRLSRLNNRIERQNIEQKKQIQDVEEKLIVAQQRINLADQEVQRLGHALEQEIEHKNGLEKKYDTLNYTHKNALKRHALELSKLEEDRAEKQKEFENIIGGLRGNLIDLKNQNARKDQRIDRLEEDLADRLASIRTLQGIVQEKNTELEFKENKIETLNHTVEENNMLVSNLRNDLDAEKNAVADLKNKAQSLEKTLEEERKENISNFDTMKKFFEEQNKKALSEMQTYFTKVLETQKEAQQNFLNQLISKKKDNSGNFGDVDSPKTVRKSGSYCS